jgi:integrase
VRRRTHNHYFVLIYTSSVSECLPDQQGYWAQLEKNLNAVLAQARAPSTTAQYSAAWSKWMDWTLLHKVCSMPAQPKVVSLYLVHIGSAAKSFSSVKAVYSAIAWKHSTNGCISPTLNPLVIETIAGLKRSLAKPVVKKEPFTVKQMQALQFQQVKGCLTDLRNNCILVIAFFGFLRFEEIVHLRCDDVVFLTSHLELTLPKSKCDQLRQGEIVVISRLGQFCPVGLLEHYMRSSGNFQSANKYVFRRVVFSKGVKFLGNRDIPLTYSNVRDVVKAKSIQLGLDPSKYGTHSMRAGGSTAAANAGIGDRIFQRHGRWASASSKDGYIQDSLEGRLSVTKALI